MINSRTVQGYEHLDTLVVTEMMAGLFSAITGDANPIHMDAAAAGQSPFGRPANFGALTLFAMLLRSDAGRHGDALKLDASFVQPVFFDLPYGLYRRREAGRERLRLTNGQAIVAELMIEPHSGPPPAWPGGLGVPERYALDPAALPLFCASLGIDPGECRVDILTILGWSSYFVGMVLEQGRRWLASITLEFHGGLSSSAPAVVAHEVVQGTVTATHRLGDANARVTLRTMSPRGTRRDRGDDDMLTLPWKRAVIVGASRGLGAAIAEILGAAGVHVIGLSRSTSGVPAVDDWCRGGDAVMLRGDAGDPAWCGEAARLIQSAYQSIDLLVLAAAPAVPAIIWRPGHIEQIRDYLDESARLILHPLTSFLPLVSAGGSAMLISSQAVVASRDRRLSGQRASKSAAEALFASAVESTAISAASILRPPRFLSDQTAGARGSAGLPTAHAIAMAVVRASLKHNQPPGLTIIEADELWTDRPSSLSERDGAGR